MLGYSTYFEVHITHKIGLSERSHVCYILDYSSAKTEENRYAAELPSHWYSPFGAPFFGNFSSVWEFLLMTKTPNRVTNHKHTNNDKQEKILRNIAWDERKSLQWTVMYSGQTV